MENSKKLEELKKACLEKKAIATELYQKIGNGILQRDFKLLIEKYNISENDKSFEFKIYDDVLEIIDRREAAFLWGFGVILDNNLRLGDAFKFNNKIYSVSFIDSITDPQIIIEIEKVILEYNDTIAYLTENPEYTSYIYHYECDHEELKCKDIFEVYQNVMNRLDV
ncbi:MULTISPECIES: hypothetical protein [Dehalobacter]|jgi:hypothetical protein|uniref:Uncharacterized protein n=2 Tax=Dehalobacter restrictus TaxID=55583 RepID=A0A857DF92_9FIRM|nr:MULTISPECIES: hypothetical protein [Dehalobacter]AHF11226.1 hypothetical protein DEHRE_02015 [Dehalobacter restrictus DSM 9455]MCG1024966.1 hypothetical protein [Dehalobacter sp.]QGZ99556.1 hypothetical protein GQ588_02255 [Dehalobacter restrictus]